jgi:pimeloyl-ACP methyl ester carboxylesterase
MRFGIHGQFRSNLNKCFFFVIFRNELLSIHYYQNQMTYRIGFHQAKIHAVSDGEGIPVVLLHGYLESLHIWDDFAALMQNYCRVIRMDLPGHGKSGIVAGIHTMEIMAESVIAVLDALSVDTCLLVGHSMGGYVALAVAESFINKLRGLCLFHSTPFPDNEEKKANRDREIELVQQGKKDLLINVNIPKGFADDNLLKFSADVERAKSIALETPDEGIVAALKGMKERRDRTSVVNECPVPMLWILGEKDNYINFHSVKERITLNSMGKLLPLRNSGHMGFIEEKDVCAKHVISFISQ